PENPGVDTPIPYVPVASKKVVTDFKDVDGNVISPREDGTTPNKSITGYEYVTTVVDGDGNTVHIYRKVPQTPTTPETPEPGTPKKVVTDFKDVDGNVISPREDGTTPNKSITGYEYVTTVVDGDGNTVHIYRKVPTTPTTPVTPESGRPGTPVTPTPGKPGTPATPATPAPGKPGTPATPASAAPGQLPNTGEDSSAAGVL
ncbi:TPA: hypothetical protein ACGOZD_002362, partial [Streptococcus suis]